MYFGDEDRYYALSKKAKLFSSMWNRRYGLVEKLYTMQYTMHNEVKESRNDIKWEKRRVEM